MPKPTGMKRSLAAGGAVLAALLASAGTASGADPLPVTATSPATGTTYAPTAGSVAFSFNSTITGLSTLAIEVSTQNASGQDGSLADDYQTDFFLVTESDANPGTYRGTSNSNALWW